MAEKKRKCEYLMVNGEKCGRDLYDDLCFFHSRGIEKKRDSFENKFRDEFKKQSNSKEKKFLDFKGFIFPSSYSFRKHNFKKRTYFIKAEFHGTVEFPNIKFKDLVDFNGADFYEEAKFNGSEFFGRSKFSNAHFYKDSNFSLTKFQEFAHFDEVNFCEHHKESESGCIKTANFTGSEFYKNVSFNNSKFHGKATFRETKFFKGGEFQGFYFKNVNNLYMDNTYFSNIRGLFEFISEKKKEFKYSKFGFLKLKITEFLPKNIRLILGENVTARFPVISRKIKDDLYLLDFRKKHPCWFFVWKLSADCGRSFLRWTFWSILLAVGFALIFWFLGSSSFEIRHLSTSSFWTMLYYSVVTFTTLGFGDVVPKTFIASICVMFEVIFGYIMLGGLISIFANKLARRS